MNLSIRLLHYRWLAPFVVIGLIIGLFAAAPEPSYAQIPECGGKRVIELKVGNYSAPEMASDPTLRNDLPSAIDTALNALKTCGDSTKHALIDVTEEATNLHLPDQIGDGSYGLISIQGHANTEPIVGAVGQKVVNKTDLSIMDMEFDVASDYFYPEAFFSCERCSVFGRGDGLSFINGQGTAPILLTVAVGRSEFHNASIISGDLRVRNLVITDSVARDDRDDPRPFIDLSAVYETGLITRILNNTFSYTGRSRDGRMVIIQRPNVTVDHNQFITNNDDEGEGIYLNPRGGFPAPFQMIDKIDIRMNTFKLRRSISNSMPDGPPTNWFGEVTFHYNDLSFSPETLPKDDTYMDHTKTSGPCNFWGDLSKRDKVKANRASMDRYLTTPPTSFGAGCTNGQTPPPNPTPTATNPPPSPTPSGSPTPDGDDGEHKDRYDGETRVETAVDISGDQFPDGAEGVIIARSDDSADSVSAVPFAKLMNIPILLTQPGTLHPAVAKEIKRLMPKGGTVYIMGREVAIHPGVEDELKKLTGKTERIAGENRAATAVESAKLLKTKDKLHHIMLADGSDWQPDLIAGPAAAVTQGATLLTWGDTVAPETAAYMRDHARLPVTAIGAKAAKTGLATETLTATDPSELSLQVIKQFFKNPRVVGFATSADFADALTGGAHMAGLRGPLVLIGDKTPAEVTKWVKDTKSLRSLIIYGGTARISAEQEAELRTALKH